MARSSAERGRGAAATAGSTPGAGRGRRAAGAVPRPMVKLRRGPAVGSSTAGIPQHRSSPGTPRRRRSRTSSAASTGSGSRASRGRALGIRIGVGVGLGLASAPWAAGRSASSSRDGVTVDRIDQELRRLLVDDAESKVTFDEFPYYLRFCHHWTNRKGVR